MRRAKHLAIWTVATAFSALAVAGCNGSTSTPPKEGPAAARTLRLGALTDLTSYTAEYGQQERAGLEALVALSGRDGIPKIELSLQDTKGAPKDAVSAANQILQGGEKPDAMFVALSSVSMAVAPVTDRSNLVVLCNATTPQVLKASRNSVRNFPDPESEIDLLLTKAAKPLGLRSVAMIYVNDEYGQSMAKYLAGKGRSSAGVASPVSESYGFDVTDFRPMVSKLVASKADGVICPGYGSQVGSLIRQIRERGFKGRILVPALIVNTESVMKAAGPAIEGVVFNGFDYQGGNPELKAFLEKFRGQYGGKQSDIGVLAYVGARILTKSLAKDGDPTATLANLASGSPFDTILGKVEFRDRSLVYPLKLNVVRGGKVASFDPSKGASQ